MSATYDVATEVGQVRLMIPDHDENADDFLFQDEELAGFLAIEGSIKGAAALALETLASDQAYRLKSIKAGQTALDGPATAKGILERAALLRYQVLYGDLMTVGGFDVAEWVNGPFTQRERLLKQALRQGF